MKFRIGLIGLILAMLAASQFWEAPARAQSGAQTAICYGRVITTLNFRNPTYVTGTGTGVLTRNAVYRFSNVNTGIDALVRIDSLNGATLGTIDNDAILTSNFQPELVGSGARSVDFTITFVATGTSTPVAFNFTAGAIDVDGDSVSIREYAEFSNALAEFTLNNPTRLVVNGSGPASPARTRFEAGTPEVADGIDPNEARNIVAVYYSNNSSFQYRIGTLGTGTTTRLTSLDFNCPTFGTPVNTTALPQDFGDAPNSYGIPRHDIVSGIRLGTANTAETASYNHPAANADAGDDGITLTSQIRGQTASAAANVSGASGRLQGWIDFNGDGDFLDAGEQISTNVQDNQTGDADPAIGRIRIDFTTPINAVTTQTFARFRWSTQANLPPNTIAANNGEVEDYSLTIAQSQQDFGDAPIEYGNPIHNVVGGIRIGPTNTVEAGPYDDNNAAADAGDDGVTIGTLGKGFPASLTTQVTGAGGQLQAWVDWNRDDDFLDAGERIALNVQDNGTGDSDPATGIIRIDFTVPAGAKKGDTFVRVRWSTQPDLASNTGIATNGEVEDYKAEIVDKLAILEIVKTSALFATTGPNRFAIPGSDVTYTITVRNVGNAEADNNSVFVLDTLPLSVEFLNGDADGPGPGTTAVLFTENQSDLSFNIANDLRYSNVAAPPATFAACTYTPLVGYDPAIRHICVRPQGKFDSGNPAPSFTLKYRVRIR